MDLQLGTRMQAGKGIQRRRPSVRQHNWRYELCQNKEPCEYGSNCTYAHSEEELHHWLKSRVEEEPRQRPSKGARAPYQMCKNVLEKGYCLNDVQCNFPHSTEELDAWTSIFQEGSELIIRPRPKIDSSAYYSICNEKAPCPKGADCFCAHSEEELHDWFRSRVEKEPRLRPIKGARCQMCKHVEKTGYCSFEMHCKFPHSKKELEAWTRIFQEESKEVRIRQRPMISQLFRFDMCENKAPCPHGVECNFAHSKEELHHWFRSRVEEEPRQEPPAGMVPVYKMCKSVEENGYCPYDTYCHYPHSKKELDAWKEVAHRAHATVYDCLQHGPHEGKESPSVASGTKKRTQSQSAQVVLQRQLSKEWPKLSGHQPELQSASNSTEASGVFAPQTPPLPAVTETAESKTPSVRKIYLHPAAVQRVSLKETWEDCDVQVKVLPFQCRRDAMQAIVEKCTPDNTIVIEDIPDGVNEENLSMYLEKVTKLDEDDFTVEHKGTKALMVLQDVVANNLEATVTKIQSPKSLLKDTRLKASRLTPVQSVLVTNICNEACREDKLKLYFKNKKKSGGGRLQDITFTAKGQAIATFRKPEDVEGVLARNHSVQLGKEVELKAYHPILTLWSGAVAQPKWVNSKKIAAITHRLSKAQYQHIQKCNLIQVVNDRLVGMKLSAQAKLDAAETAVFIEPTAGSEYDEEWSSLCSDVLQEVLDTISEASVKVPKYVVAKVFLVILASVTQPNVSITLSNSQNHVLITGSKQDADHFRETVERIIHKNLDTMQEIPLPVSVLVYADQCIRPTLDRDNPDVIFEVSLANGKMLVGGKAAGCETFMAEIEKLQPVEVVPRLPVEAVQLLSMPNGKEMLHSKLPHSEAVSYYFTSEDGAIPSDDVTPMHALHIVGSTMPEVQGVVDALQKCIAVIDLPVPKEFENTHHMETWSEMKRSIEKQYIALLIPAIEKFQIQLVCDSSIVSVIKREIQSFIERECFTEECVPMAGDEYDEEWSALQPVLDTISEASVKILEDHQSAYKESLEKHGSVELEVTRCVFVGSPAVGKSSLKHLLVHNTPKAVKTSTSVMDEPEVVTISSEQYVVGECTSAWQLVTDDVMGNSLHDCVTSKEYDDERTYPELFQTKIEPLQPKIDQFYVRVDEETSRPLSSKMPMASECAMAAENESKSNEVTVSLDKHRSHLLSEIAQGGKGIKLKGNSFIHLLDTGGQPSFQDALPLLLDTPCTYIQVFNAARDVDQPVPITYRPSDKEEVEEDEQFSAETGWEMMLRSFSGMQTMAHKCSKEMVAFQQEGSQLPKLRIFVAGTFKDQLVKDGEEMETVENICRRMKKLEGKPYYRSIQRDSSGRPFYLLNCMTEDEDEKAYINCFRTCISNAGFALRLKVPVMWFYCKQITQRCPKKFLRYQDLKAFCLKHDYIDEENAEKQFLALLHLFSLLGFYSFFSLKSIPNDSNFVCTNTGEFLREVSKLLAIQHRKAPICPAAQVFQQYGIISSDDEELFEELQINKEVDRKWFLGALEHLGLSARYADSGNSSTPFYFMPIALPQEKSTMADQGTVASLCVTFEFPSSIPTLVYTDLPRGVFCQLAVKLSNGPWKAIPEESNRTMVKFQSGKFELYLKEVPEFISLTPILMEEIDGKEQVAELHKHCRDIYGIFSKSMESAAERVLGVQGNEDRQTYKIVYGFECFCDKVPHLAILATTEGKSLICQFVQKKQRRDSQQKEKIWFNSVKNAKLVQKKLLNMLIMEEHFDSTTLAIAGSTVGPETDEHEYKALMNPKKKCQCTTKEDVFAMVREHRKGFVAMLNHHAEGTVHFGIQESHKVCTVQDGLDKRLLVIRDALNRHIGGLFENFYPAVSSLYWKLHIVKLLDSNGEETGRWRFDISMKQHADAVVFLGRKESEVIVYYRQGTASQIMPSDMLVQRIKATVSVNASRTVKNMP